MEFYRTEGLYPTLRKMYYRLIELAVITKSKRSYDRFSRQSAEARRGVDSTYTKESTLPKLPIDCFLDDKRTVIGETDIDKEPKEPEPAETPVDWEEYIDGEIESIKNSFRHLKDAPDNYDGECKEGIKGIDPGRWYNQPNYVEIWCESRTIQPDLVKFQSDLKVKVVASGGFTSVSYMNENCERLIQIANDYDHIEKIIILYFGDYDKAGEDIAQNLKNGLEWYGVENFEFLRVAVTEEQIKKYKLVANPERKGNVQLEAFLTTKKRLEIFKKIVQDAVAECWDEDIYDENCPDEEYDYEANNEVEPDSVDVDDYPESSPEEGEEDLTIRQIMEKRIAEAFKPGWENE